MPLRLHGIITILVGPGQSGPEVWEGKIPMTVSRLIRSITILAVAGAMLAPLAATANAQQWRGHGGGGGYYHGGGYYGRGGYYGGGYYGRGGYYGGGYYARGYYGRGYYGCCGWFGFGVVPPPVYYAPPPVYLCAAGDLLRPLSGRRAKSGTSNRLIGQAAEGRAGKGKSTNVVDSPRSCAGAAFRTRRRQRRRSRTLYRHAVGRAEECSGHGVPPCAAWAWLTPANAPARPASEPTALSRRPAPAALVRARHRRGDARADERFSRGRSATASRARAGQNRAPCGSSSRRSPARWTGAGIMPASVPPIAARDDMA